MSRNYEVDVVRIEDQFAKELKTFKVEADSKWAAMNAAIRKAHGEGGAWKTAPMILATNIKVLPEEKKP